MRIDRKAASVAWPMAGLVLVLTTGVARSAPPADAGAEEAHIQRLVRQLGDDSYQARERAQKELLKTGPPAIPFLEKALAESADPELKFRAEQILPELRRRAAKLLGERIKKSLLWDAQLPAEASGQLAAAPGCVLARSRGGQVMALDAATGTLRWRTPALDETSPDAPVLIGEGTAYVVDLGDNLQAVDLKTGEARSGFKAAAIFGTPVLADGVIYAPGFRGALWALDARTGRRKWEGRLGGKPGFGAAPAASTKAVFVSTGDGRIVAVDRSSGKRLWVAAMGKGDAKALAVCGDVLIARFSDRVCAVEVETGKQLWKKTLRTGVAGLGPNAMVVMKAGLALQGMGQGAPDAPGLAVGEGTVYLAAEGKMLALDARTARQKWSFAPAGGKADANDPNDIALPGGGFVRIAGGAKARVRVRVQGGGVRARRLVVTRVRGLGEPMVDGGIVYFGSGRGLHAVDRKTGETLWVFETSEGVRGRPVIAGGVIYFVTAPGGGQAGRSKLYAVRVKETK